ncbi:MAG: RNHCP domain-containing protein [Oscillospiraceae bacterium]
MSKHTENSAFVCAHCGREVLPLTNGSCRNHCPFCLYSLHADVVPGDRASPCQGLMEPVGAVYSGKKGWQIVHKCTICGFVRRNRIAENTVMPDDFNRVAALSAHIYKE